MTRFLLILSVILVSQGASAQSVTQNAYDTWRAAQTALVQLESMEGEATREMLIARIAEHMSLLSVVSQPAFKEYALGDVQAYVRFVSKIINEQSGLVSLASHLSQIATAEGLAYDDILAKRRFLMEEWTYCMENRDLSRSQLTNLLNRMLYFGLNEKYKKQAEVTYL